MPAVPNKSDGRPVRKSRTAVLLLCLLAALMAAFAFSGPLQAQDESYVDLSIEITVTGGVWAFTALGTKALPI